MPIIRVASRRIAKRAPKLPKLPTLLEGKLYKTGQTRGADDDVIFQNRVLRNSTVLIPYLLPQESKLPPDGEDQFEHGFIELIPPLHYFGTANIDQELAERGLAVGDNALVFYKTRADWIANNPDALGWTAAQSRRSPLGGQYVARVAGLTSAEGEKIIRGFSTTANKGAGIRLYEYASTKTIKAARLQLQALFWLCKDSQEVARLNGMSAADVETRLAFCLKESEANDLLDLARLKEARIINVGGKTICPLCLEEFSALGFFSKVEQAEGRAVHDLTVTQLNLFHVAELRHGVYNHRPYNVGWGHHHCNVVVKDSGISKTLEWMHGVMKRNVDDGHFIPPVLPEIAQTEE